MGSKCTKRTWVTDDGVHDHSVYFYKGTKFEIWALNDKFHREDGPALVRGNTEVRYCIHGKKHRLDGPARVFGNGECMWYVNGVRFEDDGDEYEEACFEYRRTHEGTMTKGRLGTQHN